MPNISIIVNFLAMLKRELRNDSMLQQQKQNIRCDDRNLVNFLAMLKPELRNDSMLQQQKQKQKQNIRCDDRNLVIFLSSYVL